MRETAGITRRRPLPPVAAGALAATATLVALWAYTGVVRPGLWTFVCTTFIVIVTGSGILLRRALAHRRPRLRDPLVMLVQVAAVGLAGTVMLAGETTRFGVLPTGTSFRLIGARLAQSVEEIATGVAPIPGTLPMATALGLTFAIVAILVDQLVGSRLIVLAVLLTSLVGVMPMLISFGSVNIAWFLLQSVMILLLLRFGARHDAHAPKGVSVPVATSAGAVAVAVTLVLAPMLPMASALPGTGPMLTVNADLRLGDDLRRPEGIEALTLVTSAAVPPYLRMATLSRFDGDVWRPDRGDRVPLRAGFGKREWGEDIRTEESQVSVRVLGVSSNRLPVPYAPVRLSGVDGVWSAVPENRTVVSRTSDAAGADYTVNAVTPVPTREQIRASRAAGAAEPDLPEDLPPIIADLAREVTSVAETDYDRLVSLQNWFRDEFSYSLDAPVDEGFDGTGADAVATFLEKRTGYCIHFAGAFALMASSLGMPVRIVIGYLPGNETDQRRGDDVVYSVTSDQLHSWPEVHFEGIGWVPFEPTATLGVPTAFAPASSDSGAGGGADAPEPTAAPTTGPSTAPTDSDGLENDPGAGGAVPLQRLDPTPVMLTVLGVVVLLLLPLTVRGVRRAVRVGRARSGDAVAAWRELSDTLLDLGLAAPEAQTARARADALAMTHGADPAALAPLVRAVEYASYAPTTPDAGNLANPLQIVIAQLAASVDARRRLTARMLPASLFVRRR